MSNAIQVEGLAKSFGATRALDGIDLQVPEGTVAGLLGPNGSGKTTAVRILATLLAPTAGRASVAGYDVTRQAAHVRRVIGLTGQYAAVDANLTGFENLEMIGRLLDLPRAEARLRAGALLERFNLVDAGRRPLKTYSGGMQRRLDLAASIVGRPKVLFLDEPTTGLDPRSRMDLWGIIRELVAEGTSVLLTTQYLDEADQLADGITVLDGGRVIAHGTSQQLKAQTGGPVLEVRPADPADMEAVASQMAALAGDLPDVDRDTGVIRVCIAHAGLLAVAVRRLDDAGIAVTDLALRRPSLDEVFLQLPGAGLNPPTRQSPDRYPSAVSEGGSHDRHHRRTRRGCQAHTAEPAIRSAAGAQPRAHRHPP
ncbi:MAG: ATP-binding cassette domain-containing protein [Egibacteraceae bacterium]